jgi:transcriptional regulator with GAF, ATPase, and Fis domain
MLSRRKKNLMQIEIIGKSKEIKNVIRQAKEVARTNSTTTILGENGVGKELIAHLIHQSSPRADKPFIPVACGALESGVLTSELFGHERGAFTDAYRMRKGRFELAHGGTIFLDEIGDMSKDLQTKLLRVLQERQFERVGGIETITVDVRVIAATNKNLEEEVKKGTFREDLYFRLNVYPIHIPPLRERKEDIPLLVKHFLKKYAQEMGKEVPKIVPQAMRLLKEYNWPGNVRELENCIERAVIVARSDSIEIDDILFKSGYQKGNRTLELLEEVENQEIVKALMKSKWKTEEAASLLGLHPSTLRRRIKRINIDRLMHKLLGGEVIFLDKLKKGYIITALKMSDGRKEEASKLLGMNRKRLNREIKRLRIKK